MNLAWEKMILINILEIFKKKTQLCATKSSSKSNILEVKKTFIYHNKILQRRKLINLPWLAALYSAGAPPHRERYFWPEKSHGNQFKFDFFLRKLETKRQKNPKQEEIQSVGFVISRVPQ